MTGNQPFTESATLDLSQPRIETLGLKIFELMRGETAGVFNHKNFTGRLMDWSMRNEALKVQLFRFVDVLPALNSSREIARHACEYLGNDSAGLPGWVRRVVRLSPKIPWLMAPVVRQGVAQLARTFILARNGAEAIPALRRIRKWPLAFTVDILGETAVSEGGGGSIPGTVSRINRKSGPGGGDLAASGTNRRR